MSLWIKICANTSLADAQLVVDAGANAVGFIFAPSPRQVTPEQVAAITQHLPATIEKIGVFVEATFDTIAGAVDQCALTGVQLHSNPGSGLPAKLRARFGQDLRILQVLHFEIDSTAKLRQLSRDHHIDAVLIDSRTDTAVGGTGIRFDWQAASASLFNGSQKLIAAGGLSPDNVVEAVSTLRPWGVDVASGVELLPGRKDPAKVHAFVTKARQWRASGE